jgi:hypothetical protein
MFFVLLSSVFITGELFIKPLTKVLREHNQLVADCEAKIPRDQFCELVAIPKVSK